MKFDINIDILKSICDNTRIEIIKVIGNREMNVSEISEKCEVSRPTVSHHLQILKRNRIVNVSKEGKEMYYSVNHNSLIMIAEDILKFVSQLY